MTFYSKKYFWPEASNGEFKQPWPRRGPVREVVENIKDIIKDKKVCDIGANHGDMLLEMSKYASDVVGIEIDESKCNDAKDRGLDVNCGSFEDNIPSADVYYFNAGFKHFYIYLQLFSLILGGFSPFSSSFCLFCCICLRCCTW